MESLIRAAVLQHRANYNMYTRAHVRESEKLTVWGRKTGKICDVAFNALSWQLLN